MKKSIIIASSLLTGLIVATSAAFAGCKELAHTTWKGQVRVLNKVPSKKAPAIVALNVVIDSVSGEGMFYNFTGTVNGLPIDPDFNCTESTPGKINGVSIISRQLSLTSIKFLPDTGDPSSMLGIFGRTQDAYVETSDPTKNYLNRVKQ